MSEPIDAVVGRPRETLVEQCARIGWPLDELRLPRGEHNLWAPVSGLALRPEEAVAHTIERSGAKVQWCEGGGINLLMKAACLDLLVEKLFPGDRAAAVRRYFEAQCKLLERSRNEIVERTARSRLTTC